MNPDEHANPRSSTAPTSTSTGRRIRVRSLRKSLTSIDQEARLPSIPSDDIDNENDWVSPFTLPPLPNLKRNRTQVDRSVEDQIHNRSGSSAYYAAAWGSPYATPSPNRSPGTALGRKRSLDIEHTSPIAVRRSAVPKSLRARKLSLPYEDSISPFSVRESADPANDPQVLRRIWLSESEDSEGEIDNGKTPTRKDFIDPTTSAVTPSSLSKSHHLQESVDTITPETFSGTSSARVQFDIPEIADMSGPETQPLTQERNESKVPEKPLPQIPAEQGGVTEETLAQTRPPSLIPMQSFQRPKKKVPLGKGKSCIIAVPLTDREQAGLPPLLTSAEKEARLKRWAEQGYPTYGFTIDDWTASVALGGASRPTYPDPADLEREFKSSKANVHVPNHAEWEAWVEYLKEEKLRALGVTPSVSDAPTSTMSPFSSTLSRVSSAYPSMAPSPPVPSLSAASNSRMGHSPFSPSISHPALANFNPMSARGTPQGGSRPMHGYNQSMALPAAFQRINSPFDYPISQPSVMGLRSPLDQSGRRPFSPGHVQNMQSMHSFSPFSANGQDNVRNVASNPQLEQIRRQQEFLAQQQEQIQKKIAHHHRQMSMFPLQSRSVEPQPVLPITPVTRSPVRSTPIEIVHPTPRSHRHNLSAALEQGVTDSVQATTKKMEEDLRKAAEANSEEKTAEETSVEPDTKASVQDEQAVEEEEELPILKRPETLGDISEAAEIETNPSIAGTPLLLDDSNPFSAFQPLKEPERKSQPVTAQHSAQASNASRPGHSSKPSLSKFNVQAKEFNPSGMFGAGTFSLEGIASTPKLDSTTTPVLPPFKPGHKANVSSLSKFNVAAKEFTPSFAQGTPQRSTFGSSVHSPATGMTPERPAFNPTSSFGFGSFAAATPEEPIFDPNASTFSFASAGVPPIEQPIFNPGASVFSFGGDAEIAPDQNEFNPNASTFSFNSASFNVEAPEFKPMNFNTSTEYTPAKSHQPMKSIFGDVMLDSKVMRRGNTKAVPILRPSSKDGPVEEEETEIIDADGRVEGIAERQKRARKVGADGDDELLFADSAPFKSLSDNGNDHVEKDISVTEPAEEIMQESVTSEDLAVVPDSVPAAAAPAEKTALPTIEEAAEVERQASPVKPDIVATSDEVVFDNSAEGEPGPSLDTSMVEGHDDGDGEPGPSTITSPVEERSANPTTYIDELVASKAESAETGPSALLDEEEVASHASTRVKDPAHDMAAVEKVVQTSSDIVGATTDGEQKPVVSAAAQPFVFKPLAGDFVPSTPPQSASTNQVRTPEPSSKPKKTGGLMASRFASSPPPDIVQQTPARASVPSASQIVRETSPVLPTSQQDVFVREVPESKVDLRTPRDVSVKEEARTSPMPEIPAEVERPQSVVSQTGDLSLDEINAVMKQFEDNPDLGVIREDTPIKPTPLIDLRLPHNMRSDAPSPSPRHLDGPFEEDEQRSYNGLGFEISGVHQLNYGSGNISDWDADLSPGQQDKLEARAHFFDDHVNDLVDNILESRLAPLERMLQTVHETVSSGAGKAHRAGRDSPSTAQKDSDADDEDDYDAYEGYSHYRSKSPQKRTRKDEKIKAIIAEALASHQAQAAPPATVDLSAIHEALTEMKTLAEMKTLNEMKKMSTESAKMAEARLEMSELRDVLDSLVTSSKQAQEVPKIDTSIFTDGLMEIRNALQQPREPHSDIVAMKATLDELRQSSNAKPAEPAFDPASLMATLDEVRALVKEPVRPEPEQPVDIKAIIADVIDTHPRLQDTRSQQEKEASEKMKAKIEELEAMLKVTEKRADQEAALRREAEDDAELLSRRLKEAQDAAVVHKDAAEESQKSLESFLREKHTYHELTPEVQNLRLKNTELEKTLDEYRLSSEQWREDIREERARSRELTRTLQEVREQYEDRLESRQILREQIDRVQQRMAKVMEDVSNDQAEWRKQEHDLIGKNQLLQAALDHETNRRARMELDAEKLSREHKESLHFHSKYENAQNEVARLASIIVGLQTENKSHQDAVFHAQRELGTIRDSHAAGLATQRISLENELELTKKNLEDISTDFTAQIARLQKRVAVAEADLDEEKTKHKTAVEKMFEAHNESLRAVNEKHASSLEVQLASHQSKFEDLRERHSRDVQVIAEDKTRMEQHFVEKLELRDDKIQHLESKLSDLQERLEVTQAAARAAAQAASAKGANLPTPAASVVASPPHRPIVSASIPMARGTDLPEKISPQALRESILVLQDQLQAREQEIEKLEAEIAEFDKEAPNKVKERDTEITMLRELLDVRIDDLQDLITALEQPRYDRNSVRDAAIRLKTQIKMEQQLKERAISGANLASNLPSSITSGLANLTSSPRAMVAAAAWGNWRKVRDTGASAVSDVASKVANQTPSRASSNSGSSFLSGMLTPPPSMRTPPARAVSTSAASRTLAAASSARKGSVTEARPLRAFSSQPRKLSSSQPLARKGSDARPGSSGSVIRALEPSSIRVEPPSTPLNFRSDSDFGDDVDDDASPLDGRDKAFDLEDDEVVEDLPSPKMLMTSPQRRRLAEQHLEAQLEDDEVVQVLEEES